MAHSPRDDEPTDIHTFNEEGDSFDNWMRMRLNTSQLNKQRQLTDLHRVSGPAASCRHLSISPMATACDLLSAFRDHRSGHGKTS